MKKLSLIYLASALALQSTAASAAEPSRTEKAAAVATIGVTFGAVQAMDNWDESKAKGSVSSEKPLAAYGKELNLDSSKVDGVMNKRVQIVAAPVKAEDMPKTKNTLSAKDAHAIHFDRVTGEVHLIRYPIGTLKLEPNNKWMRNSKNVAAAYFGQDHYVVTLDTKGNIRKYSVYDGREVNMYSLSEERSIREILESQKRSLPGKTVDLKPPMQTAHIRQLEGELKEMGHTDVRTYEIGKSASLKKAVTDLNARLGGARGYGRMAVAAVVPAAVTAGFLYKGDKKIEELGEVENAPQMRKLEDTQAAQGEK